MTKLIKKTNRITSDGANVKDSTNDDVSLSSPDFVKPHVVCSLYCHPGIIIYQDGIEINELAKTRNTLSNMLGELIA